MEILHVKSQKSFIKISLQRNVNVNYDRDE